MKPLLLLTLANVRHRKLRFVLCVLAMSLAVSLVVSITSGYASMERGLRAFVEQFVGATDFEIQKRGERLPSIDPDIAREVQADPRVASVHSRIEARITPVDEKNQPILPATLHLFGIEAQSDPILKISTLKHGRWLRPGETNAIVLDENAAASVPVEVGQEIRLPDGEGAMEFRVVGITRQIGFLKAFYRTGYIQLDAAQKLILPGEPPQVTKIRGAFIENVDADQFQKQWQEKLQSHDKSLVIKLVRDQKKDLDRNLKGMRLVSLLGGTVSMVAAGFIVFGTLSMGVTERRRQLAMLRAVGATRMLVAGTVVLEALLISMVGLVVGIALGLLFVKSLDWWFGDLFSAGVVVDRIGLAFAFVATTIAGLVASALPAWHASRARPLEAMQSIAHVGAIRMPWKAIVLGLLLAGLDSIIVLGPWDRIAFTSEIHREIRLYGHFILGIATLMLGFFLFSPLLVWMVERAIGPLAARLTGTRFELLRQQLSGSIWRSAGTGAALMVGLAVLIVMNVQGRSMLSSWELPTKFPDIFILADGGFGRFDDERIEKIKQTPGIRADRVMPIYVTSPKLGDNPLAIAGAIKLPEATLFIGVDPHKVFEMMDLQYRSGTRETAERMFTHGREIHLKDRTILHGTIDGNDTGSETDLTKPIDVTLLDGTKRHFEPGTIQSIKPGRYLIITSEFQRVRGYDIGDTFPLEVGALMTRRIDYTIVAVVWTPGIDVLLTRFDLGNRVQEQTAATVFGTIESARKDLDCNEAFLVAAMVEESMPESGSIDASETTSKSEIIDRLTKSLGTKGLSVSDVRAIKKEIVGNFSRFVTIASFIAWAAMIVASLGVSNTVIAGIQARRWQIGILRAIGLTRFELARLILAESALLGLIGASMGLLAGLTLGYNANKLYAYILGLDPPMVVPWGVVGVAIMVVVLLAILAGVWPAVSTSRKPTLDLLAGGRA